MIDTTFRWAGKRTLLPAARLASALCLFLTISGCYAAHERSLIDAAAIGNEDSGVASSDTPASEEARSFACAGALFPACSADEVVVILDHVGCRFGARDCVTVELGGGVDTDNPTCSGTLTAPGSRVRIVRCAPDSSSTSVRLTVLSDIDPGNSSGFVWEDASTCNCRGTSGGPMVGSSQDIELTWGSPPSTDAIGLIGPGVVYQLEICAFGPCS
jgi:hypothetical protein